MVARLPTLEEFIACGPKAFPRNSFVRERGFEELYVRWGYHMYEGKAYSCLDLANATVKVQRKGTFKRLIARLRAEHPDLNLWAENVLIPQLVEAYVRMGFRPVHGTNPPCLFLPGNKCDVRS